MTGDTDAELDRYLYHALVVIGAIYAFFLTERLLKLSVDHRKRMKRQHMNRSIGGAGGKADLALHDHDSPLKSVGNGNNGETGHLSDDSFDEGHNRDGPHCSHVQVRIPPAEVKTHAHEHDVDASDVKEHPIKTVAWMVITGDGM